MSRVSIAKRGKDLHSALATAIDDFGQQVIARGDRVLIKPNLVSPAAPDSGRITSPEVIESVARYCLDQGAARVIIGEGPSYYQPEPSLRECFTLTGVSQVAERLGVEWVLFDEHRYRTFRGVEDYTPHEFRVTEFAFTCDKFINVPVLKTHYLTTVTLAMKNLKGCLKREDKPRFHDRDLSRAVVELCKIVRPTINVIDAMTWKQGGDGLLIVSPDIVAADTVGCALMGIDPKEVRTVSLGAAAGLGEGELIKIDIVGEELKRLKFKVQLPRQQLQQSLPLLEIVGAERACSGCLIPLFSALSLFQERGMKLEKPLAILLGKSPQIRQGESWLSVGDCAETEGGQHWVPGCPPDRDALLNALIKAVGR